MFNKIASQRYSANKSIMDESQINEDEPTILHLN